MTTGQSFVCLLLATFLVPPAVHARWDSKQDNRSAAELEAMTDKELFSEAFDVCVRRAMLERQSGEPRQPIEAAAAEASDYLDVIYFVAGKRHGGVIPKWMTELSGSHTVKQCQTAFRTFLAGSAPREEKKPTPRVVEQEEKPTPRMVHEEKKPTPKLVKKAPPPRPQDPREQLPPWLVPKPE